VIVTSRDHYVLIDLEGAIKLGTAPASDEAGASPMPVAWQGGAVLVHGKYTAQSDLRQLASMLEGSPSSIDLVALLNDATTADAVLQHIF
jgi:hypothetical protein